MRIGRTILLCIPLLVATAWAQPNPPTPPARVILFLPLQLDSIFDAQSNYKLKKNEFPRFVGGPLDFYQGFVQALDSLKLKPGSIDVHVVDIRSSDPVGLKRLIDADSIRTARIWLMYGNATESKQLAEAAKKYQVPLINVNLPNDAGIEDNPYYFLCNPTLQAQCEAIYRHLQQFYPLHEIVLVRKKGGLDDRILSIWEEYGRITRGVPLRYKIIEVSDSLSTTRLVANLDSTKATLLFGASLDERFARELADVSSNLRNTGYTVELMGMSTWENVREFSTAKFKNLELIVPTPFNYSRSDGWIKNLQTRYQEKYFGRISDLYLRGFELAWMLHPALQKTQVEIAGILPGKKKLIFSEMDWQPVLHRERVALDYFENKKLYFVKRMDGNIRSVR